MDTIKTASQEQLRRLLKLFPVGAVRDYWPEATSRKQAELIVEATADLNHDLIARFVRDQAGRTKQHVYFYRRDPKAPVPAPLLPKESFLGSVTNGTCTTHHHVLYFEYEVILLGEKNRTDTVLSFLWPISIEFRKGSVVVRFTKMAKDPSAYFPDKRVVVTGTSTDERAVLGRMAQAHGQPFEPMDIHDAIVALIDEGTLDSRKAAWLGDGSTDSTALHEEGRLRRDKPDMWESVKTTEMLNTVLVPESNAVQLRHFRVRPGKGTLDFSVYADDPAHTADLIQLILDKN